MTAENKAKQLVNDCWRYADKPNPIIGRSNARALAKMCVKEILEEVHNFCGIEVMEQSKAYFDDVVKNIDNQ